MYQQKHLLINVRPNIKDIRFYDRNNIIDNGDANNLRTIIMKWNPLAVTDAQLSKQIININMIKTDAGKIAVWMLGICFANVFG